MTGPGNAAIASKSIFAFMLPRYLTCPLGSLIKATLSKSEFCTLEHKP